MNRVSLRVALSYRAAAARWSLGSVAAARRIGGGLEATLDRAVSVLLTRHLRKLRPI